MEIAAVLSVILVIDIENHLRITKDYPAWNIPLKVIESCAFTNRSILNSLRNWLIFG